MVIIEKEKLLFFFRYHYLSTTQLFAGKCPTSGYRISYPHIAANSEMSSSAPPPISLGKPSLRHRLESYYSLISPDAIADSEKWKNNFEVSK